jgi:general secretion pathway protein G
MPEAVGRRTRNDEVPMARLPDLAVLLVIVSACSHSTSGARESALSLKQKRVMTDLRGIAGAIDAHTRENAGKLPKSLASLVERNSSAGYQCWGASVPRDPWSNPYQYGKLTGDDAGRYVVFSFGADGVPGGADEDADLLVCGP